VLCVVRYRSLRRADQLSGGVLPTVACLNVSQALPIWVCRAKKKNDDFFDYLSINAIESVISAGLCISLF
jgi:hypothetical protein